VFGQRKNGEVLFVSSSILEPRTVKKELQLNEFFRTVDAEGAKAFAFWKEHIVASKRHVLATLIFSFFLNGGTVEIWIRRQVHFFG
jgi:hypothetical protein